MRKRILKEGNLYMLKYLFFAIILMTSHGSAVRIYNDSSLTVNEFIIHVNILEDKYQLATYRNNFAGHPILPKHENTNVNILEFLQFTIGKGLIKNYQLHVNILISELGSEEVKCGFINIKNNFSLNSLEKMRVVLESNGNSYFCTISI